MPRVSKNIPGRIFWSLEHRDLQIALCPIHPGQRMIERNSIPGNPGYDSYKFFDLSDMLNGIEECHFTCIRWRAVSTGYRSSMKSFNWIWKGKVRYLLSHKLSLLLVSPNLANWNSPSDPGVPVVIISALVPFTSTANCKSAGLPFCILRDDDFDMIIADGLKSPITNFMSCKV